MTRTVAGLWLFLAIAGASVACASEIVTSTEGRQVHINKDGTWSYVVGRDYAVDGENRLLELRADGTWRVVQEQPPVTEHMPVPPTSPVADIGQRALPPGATLELAKVEILKREKQRRKTVNIDTRTVFYLTVENTTSDIIQLDDYLASRFVARSSRGGTFQIESVSFAKPTIMAGERAELIIVADGSPQWFSVEYVTLEIAPNTLGNRQLQVLRQDLAQVHTRKVDSFAQPYE